MSEDIVISQPSCADDIDKNALSVSEAVRRIYATINVVQDTEFLPIRDALGRTLADDVHSTINVPSHTNSAVNGYAIATTELTQDKSIQLTVVGTTFAGQPYQGTIQPGECVRIMTGAKIPQGTDTVIMQEHVSIDDDVIRFNPGNFNSRYKPGQNVRDAGEDLTIPF